MYFIGNYMTQKWKYALKTEANKLWTSVKYEDFILSIQFFQQI